MKSQTPRKLALLTAAGLAVPLSQAEPVHETLIIASRVEMPLRQIGSTTTVISAEDIQARGLLTVTDILRDQPGIAASNNGGLGKATALRVRGEEAFRTRILVDGVDYSDPTGTQVQPQIQHLTAADIERIEILRGPQGMMYGADAGGVINIITRKGEGAPQGSVQAEYGRYGTRLLSGNLRGRIDRFDYTVFISELRSDGFNAHTADQVLKDDDGYENLSYGATLGWQITDEWRAELSSRRIDAETEFDRCFAIHDCVGEFQQDSYSGNLSWQRGEHQQRLSYSVTEVDRENFAGGVRDFLAEGELESWQYLGYTPLGNNLSLLYGADTENQKMDSFTPPNSERRGERRQTGFYSELQGQFAERFFFTAGLRHDDNDDFGTHLSQRYSAAWLRPVGDDEIKLRASYGTGFRAPSLFEIAYNASGAAFPPASEVTLKEEKSEGFDVGLEYLGGNGVSAEVTFFYQIVEDEIFFDLSSFSGYLQADGRTRSRGVELATQIPLDERTRLIANHTYNHTRDDNGEQRVRRPKQITNLGVRHVIPDIRVTLDLNMRFVRDAVDQLFGVGAVDLDDYQVMNMKLAWQALHNLEIYLRGENILGRDYQEVIGFNTAGAAYYGGVRFNF